MKKALAVIFYTFTGILLFLVSLIGFSSRWAFSAWGELDMDEIIFQLSAPLKGAGSEIVTAFLLKAALPVVLILIVYIVLLILLKKRKPRLIFTGAVLLVTIIAAFFVKKMIWEKLDMEEWIHGQTHTSDFIEENYVDPEGVKLTFPEQKRNLIFIYLESMETTYADAEAGGDFPKNIIPELTKIAQDNEDFSGSDSDLNGGLVFPGTGFTTGGIFAQSTGLPLKVSIGGNNMETQNSFFPQITGVGDILEKQGYRQIYLIGSDATFGGRRLFYKDHGDFEIRDYVYAQEEKWIDPDYEVWWGYEDEKLFSFAKDTLRELAEGEEPFNLTLLTVDTHFEDGYVCRLCKDEFEGNQYANVMACSSRQLTKFLSWIQEQDFYENTTIILSGDHTTMDADFCDNVSEDYQRKTYLAILNGDAQVQDPEKERTFSTMDLFPTTLASIGVDIEGDRLGLGTNLYSERNTLVEEFGADMVRKELSKKSLFLEELEKVDNADSIVLLEKIRSTLRGSLHIDQYDEKRGKIQVRLYEETFLTNTVDSVLGLNFEQIELAWQEYGSDVIQTVNLKQDKNEKDSFTGTADISSWSRPFGKIWVNLYIDGNVYEDVVEEYVNDLMKYKKDFPAYLNLVAEHPEWTILLGIKDEGTASLTAEMKDSLKKLGLQTDLTNKIRTSYLAVIDGGKVTEQCDLDALTQSGVLQSGAAYTVESAGYDSGRAVSIQVDGIEYAKSHRGINIVIYDNEKGCVIDSSVFDTYLPAEQW